jgi:hypothetical protein
LESRQVDIEAITGNDFLGHCIFYFKENIGELIELYDSCSGLLSDYAGPELDVEEAFALFSYLEISYAKYGVLLIVKQLTPLFVADVLRKFIPVLPSSNQLKKFAAEFLAPPILDLEKSGVRISLKEQFVKDIKHHPQLQKETTHFVKVGGNKLSEEFNSDSEKQLMVLPITKSSDQINIIFWPLFTLLSFLVGRISER